MYFLVYLKSRKIVREGVDDMLERLFKLKKNKTNVFTEMIAGLTTFMAMSYIIFINPTILSATGMDYNSVYVATIIASMIGTLFLGLIANVPYVQSAGLGLNALLWSDKCINYCD